MRPVQKFVAGCMLQGCAVGLALFMAGVPSANAAEKPACPGYHTSLDARIACAADESPEGLRRFVTRTRMIYQTDYPTAVARVARFRSAQYGFNAEVASAADASSLEVASAR